jgi:hypothetical protein
MTHLEKMLLLADELNYAELTLFDIYSNAQKLSWQEIEQMALGASKRARQILVSVAGEEYRTSLAERAISAASDRYYVEPFARPCDCCHAIYVPSDYDVVRCSDCTLTCHFDRETKKWVQGIQCPAKKPH